MATQYKLIVKENVSASTSTIALTASAANTVVASVTGTDRSASANVEVLVKKSASGSGITELAYASITTTTPTELLTAPIALEANDVLYVRTSNAGTNFIVSYVEDTESVAGQAISVLNDVDTTGVADGDALIYDSTSGNWEPGTASSVGVINDLTDVNASSPLDNQVLSWDSATSKWIPDGRLSSLYTNIKEGNTTTLTDGANSNSRMELTGTTATLKTGVTEVKMTETSPGEIDLVVAAGASGSETAFTAVEINGTTTANNAVFDVKTGTRLRIESSTNDLATIRNQASADTVIDLPTSNGTLALTSELYTDADADGQIAAASVTDLSDVTSAGSGAIITSAERTKLSGIATGAEVNAVDSVNTQTGAVVLDADDISDASTTNKFTTAADITKLAGIEASADVTDTANVTAAGALMDSEVTNLAQVKAFDSSDYATAAQGTTADSALQDVVDDTSPQLGGNLDVQANRITTSTTNGDIELDPNGTGLVQINGDTNAGAIKLMCEAGTHGVSIASPPHSAGATYDLVLPNSAGSANQVLKTDGSGNLSWTNQSTGGGSPTAYEEDSFETSANITMNSGVSTASNRVVDIMGDALAAKDNANAKKLLGFHTGSGVCVLQGMVDAGASISGASAGSPLWLGASGAFSATAPSTANEYSRVMGYYIATLQGGEVMCYFNPSIDWIQID